jgi:hypothetical protein
VRSTRNLVEKKIAPIKQELSVFLIASEHNVASPIKNRFKESPARWQGKILTGGIHERDCYSEQISPIFLRSLSQNTVIEPCLLKANGRLWGYQGRVVAVSE